MSLKAFIASLYAKKKTQETYKIAQNAVKYQQKTFENLINTAKNTQFGKDHDFSEIRTIADFRKKVPLQNYESLQPYIEKMVEGKEHILWPEKPTYIAKTSGTTSGAKYIPLTQESLPYHISAAKNALLNYIFHKKSADFVKGKMIFLQGSPILNKKNGINIGRLSGIVAHFVPNYLQKNRMPSWETNCIEDWETKVDAIVEETVNEDMRLISGIPAWTQMYFERIVAKTGKKVGEVFPNLSLIINGGVNFEPYKEKFKNLLGRDVDYVEVFPASEGFFAYQDDFRKKGLLLQANAGMFFEFVPLEEVHNENPKRLSLEEVELGKDYALIISSNAGLWAYNIGDTVRFLEKNPYRLVVSGRIKHFTSAFGEHVIGKEVEQTMQKALEKFDAIVTEFTVAPQVNPSEGLPYHEWLVEFEKEPQDIVDFEQFIDIEMRNQNIYYDDLIKGKVLKTAQITSLPKDSFLNYMKSQGKLGGQNKCPRLTNDRKIAEALLSQV